MTSMKRGVSWFPSQTRHRISFLYRGCMRIGLINELHGRPSDDGTHPSWDSVRTRAVTAEQVGFDIFVYEDALMYGEGRRAIGVWESMTLSGALAAVTSRIKFGQSVVNSPYRNPAILASMAETLNEISHGRYVLGIGAGNTEDYVAFGFPSDRRYSRFAESIKIVHDLLRAGESTQSGTFATTEDARLVLKGPGEVPIVVAGGGPKMLRLAAKYGDGWNWWAYDKQPLAAMEGLAPILTELDLACQESERDPLDLDRTLDVYSVVAPGFDPTAVSDIENPIAGSSDEIAAALLAFGSAGFDEVRCNVLPQSAEAIEAMAEVVATVQAE